MSKQKQSHIERTANEPRDESLHTLTISDITVVSPTIRLFRLEIPPHHTIKFLPGQWVDLYPPPHTGIKKPGGFTITSSPSLAVARRPPAATHRHSPDDEAQPEPTTAASPSPAYLELAIQSSPTNPPAAYLFQPAAELLRNEVRVRIGGSFVFPPPAAALAPPPLRKAVFVAGGMGINPLMSMLSFIGEQRDRWAGLEVRVLYSFVEALVSPAGLGMQQKRVLFEKWW
ncbi:bd3b671e-2a23-4bf1-95b6-53afe3ed412c [Thermothielavioides terrestris]|uniref:Bd3b671e-2a23-4bf1-95b6-53afe3ed412c n=1 Tax=Thermothielavioides terrestris TaxID=2587410 RepID=A0A3S4AN18_9PEZI|nr:bd3b671e-2a23-4bf1-95b6-53afe3ed412c [Thermothielavioides terrestris]